MTPITKRLKQHTYFILFSITTLCVLWATGFVLTHNTDFLAIVNLLPTVNHPYFLLWRTCLYSILLAVWHVIIRLNIRRYSTTDVTHTQPLPSYRRQLVIAMVVFELLIVQNLLIGGVQWIGSTVNGS